MLLIPFRNKAIGATSTWRVSVRNIYSNRLTTLAVFFLAATAILLTSCGGSGLNTNGTSGTDGTLPLGVPIALPSAVPGTISGVVSNASTGTGVSGVQVTAGGVTATTNASGIYTLSGVTPAASVLVTFDMAGYAPQARTTEAFTTASDAVLISVPIVPVASSQTFDPTVLQTLTVPGSTAQVDLPANALVTASGAAAPAPGNVTVLMTPIAAGSNPALMPGNYMEAAPIESFGAFDIRFFDSAGVALNLAAATTATLRIPVSTRSAARPASIPLYYFNTATGLWIADGTASLVTSGSNQWYQGTVTHFTTWSSDRLYPTTVTYSGCVVDAVGAAVAGATVSADGAGYTSVVSRVTDSLGNFTLPIITSETAIVQASKDIRVSNSVSTTSATNSTNATCLILAGAVATRLTWGVSPSDLDSHTLGANASHVYFGSRGSLTVAPFVALDVDDTTGYGPEVTTYAKLAKNTTYRFYVHNWSGTFTPGMTGSPARVELVIGGTPRTFAPPSGENTNAYWHVYDLSVDASCTLRLTAVQQFRSTAPANVNAAGTPTYCP